MMTKEKADALRRLASDPNTTPYEREAALRALKTGEESLADTRGSTAIVHGGIDVSMPPWKYGYPYDYGYIDNRSNPGARKIGEFEEAFARWGFHLFRGMIFDATAGYTAYVLHGEFVTHFSYGHVGEIWVVFDERVGHCDRKVERGYDVGELLVGCHCPDYVGKRAFQIACAHNRQWRDGPWWPRYFRELDRLLDVSHGLERSRQSQVQREEEARKQKADAAFAQYMKK